VLIWLCISEIIAGFMVYVPKYFEIRNTKKKKTKKTPPPPKKIRVGRDRMVVGLTNALSAYHH
jgi:hypothetical protein